MIHIGYLWLKSSYQSSNLNWQYISCFFHFSFYNFSFSFNTAFAILPHLLAQTRVCYCLTWYTCWIYLMRPIHPSYILFLANSPWRCSLQPSFVYFSKSLSADFKYMQSRYNLTNSTSNTCQHYYIKFSLMNDRWSKLCRNERTRTNSQ